jgi:hypothetical protein
MYLAYYGLLLSLQLLHQVLCPHMLHHVLIVFTYSTLYCTPPSQCSLPSPLLLQILLYVLFLILTLLLHVLNRDRLHTVRCPNLLHHFLYTLLVHFVLPDCSKPSGPAWSTMSFLTLQYLGSFSSPVPPCP